VKSKVIYLAISSLLAAALACNISAPQGASEPAPEVESIVVTATAESQSGDAEADQPAPTAEDSSSSEDQSSEAVEEFTSTTEEGNIKASVSIKNGEASFEGRVTFPGSETETMDDITVKPIDFDNTTSSGHLNFSLTCSGQGRAKVNYKGGLVDSGAPGCGESWKVYVINGSPDSHINIRLDASGDINWSLSVTGSE
jgi:hypothetical protein